MATMNDVESQALAELPYAVEIAPEEQPDGAIIFMATHPELPGCMGHGSTVHDAVEDLAEARKLYIGALVDRGIEIPRPNIRRAS